MSLEVVVGVSALSLSVLSLVISTWAMHLHSTAQVTTAFNELLLNALQDKNSCDAVFELMLPHQAADEESTKRQRLTAYFILNTMQHAFLARRWWLMDRTEAGPVLTSMLASLLRNEVAFRALADGHYDPRFVKYATDFMSEG